MKRPQGHQRCCGEDPGASAPGRNFREKLSGSTKTARKTKGRPLAPTAGLCKEKPRAATGDGPAPFAEQRARPRHRALAKSLSKTHGHFVGVSRKRRASAHHWLDLVRAQIPVGRCRLGKSHRSPPPSSLFWRRSIGWSTTVRVWRIVYPPPTASQKISFGVRGRLSRFRSYRTVRHRRTFAV